jgi:eukaryotic-like serine/threonine-protein kinase
MESGQTIAGKYRLNQLLGAGGMASVWSATNMFTERQLAIKFMLPAVARTQEAARRFLMEAKVSARIDHPNVIEVMDVGQTEDGTLFLVMELLTGVSLETALKRQQPTMTLYEFSFVMIQVARALAAAHKRGIIHRDLKPTNIFLHKSRDGVAVPKLLDFGVSKFLDDEGQKNHALTVAGTVLGSPLYMSPEQARGENDIDGRTDLFAFGGIMFEALCGTRAYEGTNFNQLIVAIATKPPKNIDELAPQMPESLREVVRACLVPERDKRINSLDAVAERLLATLPELEHLGVRLPAPAGSSADPDATNALPVVKPSDRPPPLSLSEGGGMHTPWATPSGMSTLTVNKRRQQQQAGIFIALGAAAVVFIVTIVGVAVAIKVRRATPTPPTIASAAPPPTPPLPPPSPTVDDPPVYNVDKLPVASKPGAGGARVGRLTVTADGFFCPVALDGKPIGTTPIAQLMVPSGTHNLRCEPPGGKVRSATIVVMPGNDATVYKFPAND